jgi:hypothetical protein
VSAPSRARATDEFIGAPADRASQLELKLPRGCSSALTRSMSASPHTTNRVLGDEVDTWGELSLRLCGGSVMQGSGARALE